MSSGDIPPPPSERCQVELELLQAIYPDAVIFDPRSGDLTFQPRDSGGGPGGPGFGSKLVVRLPDEYPEKSAPTVVSASDGRKQDLRNDVVKIVADASSGEGGEILDVLMAAFVDLVSESESSASPPAYSADTGVSKGTASTAAQTAASSKTVIVWLHHLLAISKRKLALSPPAGVSGLTKPGYPGIMVFSGPAGVVDAHVAELKSLNWQAFVIKHDSVEEGKSEEWSFGHGKGMAEVESMADVVGDIVDEGNKGLFLRVLGVK